MKRLKLLVILGAGIIALTHMGFSSRAVSSNAVMKAMPEKTEVATFAGGCFWCTEADFEKLDGVLEAVSGYSGGDRENPTYEEVSSGRTRHLESVQVTYDPSIVTYDELLDYFWRHIDPTDDGGQFVDRGDQYRSAVFYHDETQKEHAMASRDRLAASGTFERPVVTSIVKFKSFYPAETYHQDYYRKNPLRYGFYRLNSGRDRFIEMTWADRMEPAMEKEHKPKGDPMENKAKTYSVPDDMTLKKRLSDLEYRVTRENATEPPFSNRYWDNKERGIYVDIVSGEPLFSSRDKFDSGTGWPSFTRPLEPGNIVEHTDRSLFMVRTEVRSRHADSHLGHLFDDGPPPTGLRYCINSAALRFVPEDELVQNGLEAYSDDL